MRQGPRRLRVVVVLGENLGGLFRTQKHEYTRSSWGTLPWESVKINVRILEWLEMHQNRNLRGKILYRKNIIKLACHSNRAPRSG